jgi:hypothetical protein
MEQGDPKRNTVQYDATVVVAQVVEVGSLMQLQEHSQPYFVKSGPVTPDIKARFVRYTLGLMRYGGVVPNG